jgi:hypothetical protein
MENSPFTGQYAEGELDKLPRSTQPVVEDFFF